MLKTVSQKVEAILNEQYPLQNLAADPDLPEIIRRLRNRQLKLEIENNELHQNTTISDITRHKRIERSLQASEALNRAIIDGLSANIAVLDETGEIIAVNNQWLQFGLENEAGPAESIQAGVNYLAACRPAALENDPVAQQVLDGIEAVLQGKSKGFELEYPCHAPHEQRWYMIRVTPLPGAQQGVIVAHENVTRRKQLEQNLRENEARFRLLTEKASDLICLHEPDGRYLYLSPSCERLLGYTPEELLGQNPYNLFHPEDIRRIQVEVHDKVRRGHETSSITYRIRRKSGEYIWFETYAQPVLNHHHQVTRLISASRDVTERWQAELALLEERALLALRVEERTAELRIANVELARAARLKDEFLANMSHELRTPLNGILGMSEALQMEIFGSLNDKQRDSVKNIEEGGRHLLSLINDILDLSKIEACLLELNFGTVSVVSLCQSSLRFVQQQALKKRIKLISDIDPQAKALEADERRLKQILVNLLSNAVKFTPPGGQVGLEVARVADKSALHFTVWDTGVGITEADAQRLFQPFVQLDSSLAKEHEGTGLGLALVYRLAELHGGSVTVESQVGRGSRFTVSIPWRSLVFSERLTEEPPPPTRLSAASAGRPRPLLLLVEDNEVNIKLTKTLLETDGYQVVVARNGYEAVERAREKQPALILMDIQMPGLDGLEAIRRIRAEAETAQIPIIALTALAMVGDKERCLEAGANTYLSKPVSIQRLFELIEEYLKTPTPP